MNKVKTFDLTSLSDIPKEVLASLRRGKKNRTDKVSRLIALFRVKEMLTTDEIIVGYYRCHNEIINRAWVSSVIYNLVRDKTLEVVHKGTWRLRQEMEVFYND